MQKAFTLEKKKVFDSTLLASTPTHVVRQHMTHSLLIRAFPPEILLVPGDMSPMHVDFLLYPLQSIVLRLTLRMLPALFTEDI